MKVNYVQLLTKNGNFDHNNTEYCSNDIQLSKEHDDPKRHFWLLVCGVFLVIRPIFQKPLF